MAERLSINEAPTSTLQETDGEYYFPAVFVRGDKDITPVKVGLDAIQQMGEVAETRFSPTLRQYSVVGSDGVGDSITIDSTVTQGNPSTYANIEFQGEDGLARVGSRNDVAIGEDGITINNAGTYRISWRIGIFERTTTSTGSSRFAVETEISIGLDVHRYIDGYIRPITTAQQTPVTTIRGQEFVNGASRELISIRYRVVNLSGGNLNAGQSIVISHTDLNETPRTIISIERIR